MRVISVLESKTVKKVKKIATMRACMGDVRKLMMENPLPDDV
jgi:hypothetical protein